MIFHDFFTFFFSKNESAGASLVQVCCKLAPQALFFLFCFCFFFFFFNMFFTCFFMWFIVFCENHLVLVGNKWITTVCVQVFFNTIYIYYLVTTTLFSKPKSNMYFQHVSGKCTMAASNPSTQLNFFLKKYIYFF